MDEEPFHVSRHKKPMSLFRRLLYLVVMVLTGGGAGIGGWALKDHPVLQAILGRVLPTTQEGAIDQAELKDKLASVVSGALKLEDAKSPGVYRVKVTEVRLDPKLFKEGHTVDIQARIRKRDGAGKEINIWESRPYGENLGLVGHDDLSATWANRPFEIDWTTSDTVFVEIWDRESGLFAKKELKMSPAESGVFPLASGSHALSLSGANLDIAQSKIVFESQRIGDSHNGSDRYSKAEVARHSEDRPIVIK
jgi:hypothetical protein